MIQSSTPIAIQSSGLIYNGILTLNTPLDKIYNNPGIWMYFPAEASLASGAGWYWVVMFSYTIGQIYTAYQEEDSKFFVFVLGVPKTQTPLNVGGAAYIQTLNNVSIARELVTGNYLGGNGKILVSIAASMSNTNGDRSFSVITDRGDYCLGTHQSNDSGFYYTGRIQNRGVLNRQSVSGGYDGILDSNGQDSIAQIDTAINQTYLLQGSIGNVNDWIIFQTIQFDVFPKVGQKVTYTFPTVAVPIDFLGMTIIEYPLIGVNPVNKIKWKTLRLSQQAQSRWSHIETSIGVYTWTDLDSIITFQRTNGASVIFGLYGTPAFYASTTPNPTAGDRATLGPWGDAGEGANPTGNLAAVTAFVTAVINRYNKAGGAWFDANGATLGKGIAKWETWNEPEIAATGSNEGGRFWWGTGAQMVDLCYTQYAAVKAADSTVLVSSPGFSGEPNPEFFSTTGTATGKTGAESCDAIAFHPYGRTPAGVSFMDYGDDIVRGAPGGIRSVQGAAVAGGYDKPLWITEWGIDGDSGDETNLAWYAQTATARYTWMARFLMTCAAMGVQVVCPWNWNDNLTTQGISGNWQTDTNGVQKAFNDFSLKVSGKTINSSIIIENGTVTLIFTDGSKWIV